MSWHTITFDAGPSFLRFHKEVESVYLSSVATKDFGDFAVFTEFKPMNDELFTLAYLTPAASRQCAQLIAKYSATRCENPKRELIVLIGRGDCERLLELPPLHEQP